MIYDVHIMKFPCYKHKHDENENPRKWIVNAKGEANSKSFEISVLRQGQCHGRDSYGWFDKNKLLISHNGGPCAWPLTKKVWDKMIILANDVAYELNEEEEDIK